MSRRPRPWSSAVPEAVLARLANARNVLVVSHENPDADTLGAALAVATIVEARGGRATTVCSDPVPAALRLPARDRAEPDRSGARRGLRPARRRRLRLARPGRRDPRAASAPCSPGCPGWSSTTTPRTTATAPTDWIDPAGAATCEMVALIADRLGRARSRSGEGALATVLMAGIVMDTATFAHPNATPRTLAVAAALVEAGAPLSEISRRLYRSKPDGQLRLFGRVLDRLESTSRRSGRLVDPDRRRPGRDRDDRGPLGGDHRPPRPRRSGPR